MSGQTIHALTNLSAGYQFELPVSVGTNIVAVAQAYLADRGLSEDEQRGFYVSVFPTRDLVDGDAEDRELPPVGGATTASAPATDQTPPAEPLAGATQYQPDAQSGASGSVGGPEAAGETPEAVGRPYVDPNPDRPEVPLRWETESDPTFTGVAESHDSLNADEDQTRRAGETDFEAPGLVGLIPTPEQRRDAQDQAGGS